ncbi:MAG: hypothetical protein H6617_11155 [Bdellovibrionaceae bacterium]|nr:hypothetical protein [Bdellovibrionales bacterium]MCB9255230.1 hypothetical protein [Pseudobdellovibrionaceae bacterium]
MRRLAIVILLGLSGLSQPLLAEDTPAAYTPPLMSDSLPRVLSRVDKRRYSRRRSSRIARAPQIRSRSRAVIYRSGRRWGAQFSVLGKKQNTNGGVLGMLPAFGIRGFMDFPIVGNFILEPNIGAYVSAQGVAELRTTQFRLTPGVDVLYSPNPVARTRFQIGITNKLDVIWSQIQAFNDSSSGLGLGYRVGPTAGVAFKTGRDSAFALDMDWTFDVLNEGRLHFGISAGMAFWL